MEIHTANTAEKGLQAVRRIRFDVFSCDSGMNDMNGLEVGKAIMAFCKTSNLNKIPFMLYTGYDTKLEPEALESSGVDRIVPVPAEELLSII